MSEFIEEPPFERITKLIGRELAARMSAHFGGRRLYVPAKLGEHHPLSVSVGLEAARIISENFKHERLDIPLTDGKRARIVHMRHVEKLPVATIARELICTERHVYQVLSEHRGKGDAAQKSLFD